MFAMSIRTLFFVATAAFSVGLDRSRASEVPVDPPVHSFWTAGETWIGAEDDRFWVHGTDPADGRRAVTCVRLPVSRLAPEVETFKLEHSFWPIGVIRGWLFGRPGWPEEGFRVVDPRDGRVVLNEHLPDWNWSYDRHHVHPGGYTDYNEANERSPDLLLRFDAVAQTLVQRPVFGVRPGYYPIQRLLGAGDSWLVFRRWPGSGAGSIVVLDANTLAERSEVFLPAGASLGHRFVSAGDTLFVPVDDGLVAINGITGTHEPALKQGADPAVWESPPVAGWGDDLWTYLSGEVRLWRKGSDGRWANVFRGGLPGWDEFDYGEPKFVATPRGLFVKEQRRVHLFSPEASRPVMKPWRTARLSESAGVQALWLTLDRPPASPVSVRVKSAGGSATAGTDYEAVDREVIFPAGVAQVAVPVSVTADLLPEAHETIRFELSEPRGLSLPESRQGGAVILASGLQLDEWVPEPVGIPPFQGKVIERHGDVTIGYVDDSSAADAGAVYLWDSVSGRLRGRTPFSMAGSNPRVPSFLELDGRLEGIQPSGDSVVWHELDPATGRSLRSRVMNPGTKVRWTILLGGARVLFVRHEPGSSIATGVVISADDPPGVTREFELPEGPNNSVEMSFACDGRHFAMGWKSGDLSQGYPKFLRWYDARTLEVIGDRNVTTLARCQPVALRGGLLLCESAKGVVAFRMPAGEMVWQVDDVKFATAGDSYWFSRSGEQLPVARDLETGADISAPDMLGDTMTPAMEFVAHGEGGVMVSDSRPAWPDGAMRTRYLAFSPERTRPGVRLLNDRLEIDGSGSRLGLALAEPTGAAVEVEAIAPPQDVPGFSSVAVDGSPVRLPADGSRVDIPYGLESFAVAQPVSGPQQTLEFRVTTPGQAPFRTWADLPLHDHVPLVPRHRLRWVEQSIIWARAVGMRVSDGRLLAWSGSDIDPGNGAGDVVYVINPASGRVERQIADPRPESGKRFGVNAVLQGGKIAVISRFKNGGGVVDIFEVWSGRRIKSLVQRGPNPGFGASLASDETYFAVGSPGLAAGNPSGSQVEVYRWSDFKRVMRKAAKGNARLGEDVVLRHGVLHATTAGRSAVASFSLPKGKPAASPLLPAPGGAALIGEGSQFLLAGDSLRSFRDDGSPSWSLPNPLRATDDPHRVSVSQGLVVLHDRFGVVLHDESDGSRVARVNVPYSWSSETRDIEDAAVAGNNLFTLQDSSLRITPLEDVGDFRAWCRFRGVAGSEAEFAAYVASRTAPALPIARAVAGQAGVQVDSPGLPPPDVLILVEMEIRAGEWRALAWREGRGPWTSGTGVQSGQGLNVPWPHGIEESSAVRVRHVPLTADGGLPAGTAFVPWIDLHLPTGASGRAQAGDVDGDGYTDATELGLGMDPSRWDSSPLMIEPAGGGLQVSHLRPRGEAGAPVLESSDDLLTWRPAEGDSSLVLEVAAEDDQFERVTATPVPGRARKFFRLVISP